MKRAILAGALASFGLAVAGCSPHGILTASVPSQKAKAPVDLFDAAEIGATGYLTFCAGAPTAPKCDKPDQSSLATKVRDGRVERERVVGLIKANHGGPIPVVNYNTLSSITKAINDITGK